MSDKTDAEALADDLDELSEVKTTMINDEGNVYVEVDEIEAAERALTVGHDHGWTPNGIITTVNAAWRFKPREDTEYDV